MLGLKLLPGRDPPGNADRAFEFKETGATQVPAAEFLAITYYPTDLIGRLRAAGPGQSRPIALMGEGGLGKSHLLGALYHALTDQRRRWSVAHPLGRCLRGPVTGDAATPIRAGVVSRRRESAMLYGRWR
jgi:hypothetical protein